MALDSSDIEALCRLLREELRTALEAELAPFQSEMRAFRDDTQRNFDALFKLAEIREQEALVVTHQLAELGGDVDALKKKVA